MNVHESVEHAFDDFKFKLGAVVRIATGGGGNIEWLSGPRARIIGRSLRQAVSCSAELGWERTYLVTWPDGHRSDQLEDELEVVRSFALDGQPPAQQT